MTKFLQLVQVKTLLSKMNSVFFILLQGMSVVQTDAVHCHPKPTEFSGSIKCQVNLQYKMSKIILRGMNMIFQQGESMILQILSM